MFQVVGPRLEVQNDGKHDGQRTTETAANLMCIRSVDSYVPLQLY